MQEGTATAASHTAKVEPVNIVFTKSDDENSIMVKPGKFKIRIGDQVQWNCASPGFSVDFYGPKGSPFPESHYPTASGGYLSGPATTSGDDFTYKVTIGGNVLDPSGKVDP